MTKPLFAQNILGLTLVLCIVFIAAFFFGSISKGFRVLKSDKSLTQELLEEVMKLLSVQKLKHETYVSDIPLKCQNSKIKDAVADKYGLIYVLYNKWIISSLFFY